MLRSVYRSLACLSLLVSCGKAASKPISSGKALEQSIYWLKQSQDGCIKLLNRNGTAGCESAPMEAPLQIFDGTLSRLQDRSVALVDESILNEALDMLETESSTARGIIVLLNESTSTNQEGSIWDKTGSGRMWQNIGLPIQAAGGDDAFRLTLKAEQNAQKDFKGALHIAKLDNSMFAEINSSSCLAAGSCQPLGGHSVWAAMPPFPADGSIDGLPVILVISQADGIGLFHDLIKGADAPMSGLAAMLTAAEILKNQSSPNSYHQRLVFAAFAGEPFGNMGARKLLWDLTHNENSTRGLTMSSINQLLEIGQIGRIQNDMEDQKLLFYHPSDNSSPGEDTLWDTIRSAASLQEQVKLRQASESIPGLPPSSLKALLRTNSSWKGGILAEYDTQYTNKYYATPHDSLAGINYEGIAAVAQILAVSLHSLADSSGSSLQVDVSATLETVIDLMHCLAGEAILDCPRAKASITRVGLNANYVGVLHTLTKESQDPNVYVKNDMSRFIWNTLAAATSGGPAKLASGEDLGCNPYDRVCEAGAVCINYRVDEGDQKANGHCIYASAKYLPTHSTAVVCKDCDAGYWGSWTPIDSTAKWEQTWNWPPDPVWTESTWDEGIPSMLVFQVETPAMESDVLLAGIVVTITACCLSFAANIIYRRSRQHQYLLVDDTA